MDLRNILYSKGIIKAVNFNLPVLSVGNIAVGGTGKTPFTEYLVCLLKSEYSPAILSRGYKRKTRGLNIADETDNALTLGDEPFQYYRKFGPDIPVAVAEDRVFAIPLLLDAHPDVNIILLDDAFQHRAISPSFNILLTDYNNLFSRDYVLPAGNLRERRGAAGRSDVIVVTKCDPAISKEEMNMIISALRQYAPFEIRIFFSFIQYDTPQSIHDEEEKINEEIILVTGIADPTPLLQHLKKQYTIIRHFQFPDHHYFTRKNLLKITCFLEGIKGEASLLFTEKDILRIIKNPLEEILISYPVFFQPISYKFVQHGSEFNQLIMDHIENFDRN